MNILIHRCNLDIRTECGSAICRRVLSSESSASVFWSSRRCKWSGCTRHLVNRFESGVTNVNSLIQNAQGKVASNEALVNRVTLSAEHNRCYGSVRNSQRKLSWLIFVASWTRHPHWATQGRREFVHTFLLQFSTNQPRFIDVVPFDKRSTRECIFNNAEFKGNNSHSIEHLFCSC